MRAGPDRRLFDLWSRVYDLPWVQRLTYRPEQDAVLRHLGARAPGRVLDLGCGTGILATRLRGALPGVAVVGCDFSRGMLRRAAARGAGVGWVRGDAGQLPFAAGSFAAAVSTEAFHWFPDPDGTLGELHRVLRPRGALLVALVNPPLEWLARLSSEASHWLGEPFEWPTAERMRQRVERAGFRVETQERIFRLPAPLLFPTVLTIAARS